MSDSDRQDELARRLARLAAARADAAGSPPPLTASTRARIRHRQRAIAAAATVLVVLAVAGGLAAARSNRGGGIQVSSGPGNGSSCYPSRLPRELADRVRGLTVNLTPVAGAVPHARAVVIPAGGAPTATLVDGLAGGYVIELSGRHFTPMRTPPGYVDPAPHRANFETLVFDRSLLTEHLSISDRPSDLGAIGTPFALSLDPDCDGGTTTTNVPTPTVPPGTPECDAGPLTGEAHLGAGGTGTGLLVVSFTNHGSAPCVLAVPPADIQLLPTDGTRLNLRYEAESERSNLVPVLPAGKPNGVSMDIGWGNWCGPPPTGLQVRVIFAHDRGALTLPIDYAPQPAFTPRCDQPDQPSYVDFAAAYPN